MAQLERDTGRTFGAGPNPLLVSIRSGAAQSMPGMMDTVLNLGLTAAVVGELAAATGDRAWAQDTWSRFCSGYGEIVLADPDAAPPANPYDQLREAIAAVFGSWTNERVAAYRRRHQLGDGGGTAVTVQAMVFGNRDDDSGTGVLFSRDPATGVPELFGEWLTHAQGEDVVSGERTPETLAQFQAHSPQLYVELERIAGILEAELRDLVDIEFTVESGRLYMLQCRRGKRSGRAAARIAVDLVNAGTISQAEALEHISVDHAKALATDGSVTSGAEVLATGTGASPGVATGVVYTDTDEACDAAAEGVGVVLVRPSTSPVDVPAMFESLAVVTEVGGATSHAALVCREISVPCVVGCGAGLTRRLAGQTVTVDGATGTIFAGEVAAMDNAPDQYLQQLLSYLDNVGVRDHPLVEYVLRPTVTEGAS